MKNRYTFVEVSIFAVVSLIFLNSIYGLFMGTGPSGASAQRAIAAANSDPDTTVARDDDAQDDNDFVVYRFSCKKGEVFRTSASKIRILGAVCPGQGRSPASQPVNPGDAKIENRTNRYAATVFHTGGKDGFSTDFMPLQPGKNQILMDFAPQAGGARPAELTIIRK